MPGFNDTQTLLEQHGLDYNEQIYDFIMLYLINKNMSPDYQSAYKYYDFQQKKSYVDVMIRNMIIPTDDNNKVKEIKNAINTFFINTTELLLELKNHNLKKTYFLNNINKKTLSLIENPQDDSTSQEKAILENFCNTIEDKLNLLSLRQGKVPTINYLNSLTNQFNTNLEKLKKLKNFIEKGDKNLVLWVNTYLISKYKSPLFHKKFTTITDNNTAKKEIETIVLLNFLMLLESKIILSFDPTRIDLDLDLYANKITSDLKNAWAQKKFRDSGKTKKEFHLPLTKQSKNKLQKLSSLKNCSESELLETLINECYEQNKKYFH